MAIVDKVLNELQAEKLQIIKFIDSGKGDQEEYKRRLKNVSEKIRYRQKKLEENPQIAEEPTHASKAKVNSLKEKVIEGFKTTKDIAELASKIGAKKASIAWYISKLQLK